jgi:hypothetical protein
LDEVIEYDSPGWATYIPGRRPTFKAHTHIGLAKLALSCQRSYGGKWGSDKGLYQLVMGDNDKLVWKLHTTIKAGTTQEDYPEIWKPKTTKGDK